MTVSLSPASRQMLGKFEIDPRDIGNVSLVKQSDYIAALSYLTNYIAENESSHPEQIETFLHTCHHFCNAEAWKDAWQILSTPFFEDNHRSFARYLDEHQRGSEQLALYAKLIGKLDRLTNAHCLYRLGQGYYNSVSEDAYEKACHYLNSALIEFRKLRVTDQIGWTLKVLGMNELHGRLDADSAKPFLAEAVEIFRQIGDNSGLAHTLNNLAEVLNQQGFYEEAEELLVENLDILYNHLPEVDIFETAWAHLAYGKFLADQGRFNGAHHHNYRAIRIFRKHKQHYALAWALVHQTGVLIHRGRHWSACVVLHALANDYCDLAETSYVSAYVYYNRGIYGLSLKNYALALQSFQNMASVFQNLNVPGGYVEALSGVALVALYTDQREISVQLFAAAESIGQRLRNVISPAHQKRNESALDQLRKALGNSIFQHHWCCGQSLEEDQAVIIAMSIKL